MKKGYEYREPLEEKAWEKYGLLFWMTGVSVVFGAYGAFLGHEMDNADQKVNNPFEEHNPQIIKNIKTRD
ncbi:MAG: hypothetical protein IKY98_04545 [Alphaproteobacteria bacterium]|nr:hypothetical protein [Alphaproteobacteria bacterium]